MTLKDTELMNYCGANIINFTLIKSLHKVQKAQFPKSYEKQATPSLYIYVPQSESTLQTEVSRAQRPEAESRDGKWRSCCILDRANNVAGLTNSPRKRPLIRPLHVHPCQPLKERWEEKRPWGTSEALAQISTVWPSCDSIRVC